MFLSVLLQTKNNLKAIHWTYDVEKSLIKNVLSNKVGKSSNLDGEKYNEIDINYMRETNKGSIRLKNSKWYTQ